MDEVPEKQFDELCQEFGMNASIAINVLTRAVTGQRMIPSEISYPQSEITREGAIQVFTVFRTQAKIMGLQI